MGKFVFLVLIINSIELFGQPKTARQKIDSLKFAEDYVKVQRIYESNAKQYFAKFARMQYRVPKDTTGFKDLVASTLQIYQQMGELIAKENFKVMLEDVILYKEPIDLKKIGKRLDVLYRRTFTGFDYYFYETCEKEVAELK